jgi:hypothetical protein
MKAVHRNKSWALRLPPGGANPVPGRDFHPKSTSAFSRRTRYGIYHRPLHDNVNESHMDDPFFAEFARSIRVQCGLSAKQSITPESKFEDDLGVIGDDGYDLLKSDEKAL